MSEWRGGILRGLLAVLTLLGCAASLAGDAGQPPSAEELLRRVNEVWNPLRVSMRATMTMVREGKTSQFEIRILRDGPEKARIDFLAPPKDEGKVLLQRDGKTWLYLPRAGKTVAISPKQSPLGGMMFSDLFPENLENFNARTAILDGEFGLELLPRKGRELLMSRIYFDQKTLLPLRREMLSAHGAPLKTIYVESLQKWQEGEIPRQIKIIDRMRNNMEIRVEITGVQPLGDEAAQWFDKELLGGGAAPAGRSSGGGE